MNFMMLGSRLRRDYLRHDYVAEMREAWARLGERIKDLLDDRTCSGAAAWPE